MIPLGLTAAASAADAGIKTNSWIADNNINNLYTEMDDIMKTVKSLEESSLLMKVIS